MRVKYFYRGKWHDEDAFLPLSNRGFLYGESHFTSLRLYKSEKKGGGRPFWPDHLQRLYQGQHHLFPDTPVKEWKKFLKDLEQALIAWPFPLPSAAAGFYLRIMLWADFPQKNHQPVLGIHSASERISFALILQSVSTVNQALSLGNPPEMTLGLSSLRRAEHKKALPFLCKTPSYLMAAAELRQQKKNGVDDIVYLTTSGKVTEASSSNIFIIKKGVISTPRLSSCVLPGVTRKNLILCLRKKGFSVSVRDLSLRDLQQADEIFLTNSVREIVPVTYFQSSSPMKKRRKKNEMTREIHSIFSQYLLKFLE